MSSTNDFKPVRKAVFPVAGLGTRFLPATKVTPKELLPLNDRPVIQHAVEEAREAGIEEFIFVTTPRKDMLIKHFAPHPELEKILEESGDMTRLQEILDCNIEPDKIFEAYQQNPLGLGHAVWCAKDLVGDEPFAILLPDDVFITAQSCLSQMMDTYNELGGNLVAAMDVSNEDTARYGILDVKSDNGKTLGVKAMVEKPGPESAPSNTAIIGRYILQPEIFTHLAAFDKGAGGEIQLTDAMAKLIGSQPFNGLRFDGTRYDCGTRLGFIEANIAFSLQDSNIRDDVQKILEKYYAHAG